jgi:hypothetical protein
MDGSKHILQLITAIAVKRNEKVNSYSLFDDEIIPAYNGNE